VGSEGWRSSSRPARSALSSSAIPPMLYRNLMKPVALPHWQTDCRRGSIRTDETDRETTIDMVRVGLRSRRPTGTAPWARTAVRRERGNSAAVGEARRHWRRPAAFGVDPNVAADDPAYLIVPVSCRNARPSDIADSSEDALFRRMRLRRIPRGLLRSARRAATPPAALPTNVIESQPLQCPPSSETAS